MAMNIQRQAATYITPVRPIGLRFGDSFLVNSLVLCLPEIWGGVTHVDEVRADGSQSHKPSARCLLPQRFDLN